MALLEPQLRVLAEVLQSKDGALKMLSLGYPDLLVENAVVEELFGSAIANQLSYRDDSAEILAWHGFSDKISQVIDSAHFFSLVGVTCEYIDIVKSRSVERVVDLNDPLPEDLVEQFDFLLDPGTIEHCCNIGQALKNIAMALKQDGYVCHCAPLSMFNHGFYNINPTLFADFYGQNDFKVEFMAATDGDRFAPDLVEVPEIERFTAPVNASILVVAWRQKVSPLTWPTQSKYLANPDLKASSKTAGA
jgi:hypothetical protein